MKLKECLNYLNHNGNLKGLAKEIGIGHNALGKHLKEFGCFYDKKKQKWTFGGSDEDLERGIIADKPTEKIKNTEPKSGSIHGDFAIYSELNEKLPINTDTKISRHYKVSTPTVEALERWADSLRGIGRSELVELAILNLLEKYQR